LAGGEISRYLVREPDGRLRWALAADVKSIGERPSQGRGES
jgi:hypothetical protein